MLSFAMPSGMCVFVTLIHAVIASNMQILTSMRLTIIYENWYYAENATLQNYFYEIRTKQL